MKFKCDLWKQHRANFSVRVQLMLKEKLSRVRSAEFGQVRGQRGQRKVRHTTGKKFGGKTPRNNRASENWDSFVTLRWREKEGDLTQSYDKTLYTNRKFEKPKDNTQTPPKTSITQRLRTDLGRAGGVTSHSTGVVKPVYGYPTFPLTAKAV